MEREGHPEEYAEPRFDFEILDVSDGMHLIPTILGYDCGNADIGVQLRDDGNYYIRVAFEDKVVWGAVVRRDPSRGGSAEPYSLLDATTRALWAAVKAGKLPITACDTDGDAMFVGAVGLAPYAPYH